MPFGDMPIPNGGDGDGVNDGCVLWLDFRYFTESYWWDVSKYRNNGVVHGTKWKANAFYFDGDEDYIKCEDSQSLAIDKEITIAAWVYPKLTNHSWVICKPYHSTHTDPWADWGIWLGYDYNRVQMRIDETAIWGYENSLVEEWQFITGVYDGTYMYLYNNCEEIADPVPKTGNLHKGGHPLFLGRNIEGGEQYRGYVGSVYIFSKALSIDEINILYNLTYRRW